MNKRSFFILIAGIFLFVILFFSFLIIKNNKYIQGCMDCTYERTLTGKGYDGWKKLSDVCEEYVFNKESSLRCFNSNILLKFEEQDIIQSEIKVPSLQMYNTVLTSKKLPAFIIISTEMCRPSFAILADGSMYSAGGCLG
jgi:hypothetical protein